ncbi:MAG: RtcB family protein, partial [Candidatus Margulisiibacteriota bacterium]
MTSWKEVFQKIDDYRWKIPKSFKEGMRVDGIIYADEEMLEHIVSDNAHLQVVNVAFMPGIVKASLAMPDIHYGYGFPIGGVAAFDPEAGGVISPGGVGFDINCGVRVVRTNLNYDEVAPKIQDLADRLARDVPSGVGSEGPLSLSSSDLDKLMIKGSKWAVEHGYGVEEDIIHTEENGAMEGADPSLVSRHAKERGSGQQGTLGSGNHFLEVQKVDEVFDEKVASAFGLWKDQITIMVHSGSRGLGHQVCTDYLGVMNQAVKKYGISLPDRQLCCAPIDSAEGKNYFAAMAAAANYAWANRQMLMHWTCEAFAKIMGGTRASLGIT